jgi:signal peptidase I
VEVRAGVVYVDGVGVVEPYVAAVGRADSEPELVPEGMLFVLGDNRNNSFDSRAWGMLDREAVIGRADLRYWPLRRAGPVSHYRPQRAGTGSPAAAELSAVPASP